MNSNESRNTAAIGITLIGVILSIATTIVVAIRGLGFWQKVFLGVVLFISLLILTKLLTSKGTGPLSLLGTWLVRS